MQRTPNTSIALGSGTQAEKEWSVAVGNMAHALEKSVYHLVVVYSTVNPSLLSEPVICQNMERFAPISPQRVLVVIGV
ncbi:hypothetical protein [Bartonella sp. TS82HLJMH]|uniref:hypothetical protein n=1 Tax=Bartonella sp. TS82HLJMH TaxID=3243577 RepID=UPI0035CEBDCA